MSSIIIAELDVGKSASFIAIVVVLVLIESELSISTFIHIKADILGLLLVAVFHSWTERYDAAATHIDRSLVVRSRNNLALAALALNLTCHEVIPHIAFWEIDLTVASSIDIDRANHESRTAHELVTNVLDLLVSSEVHDERTKHGIVVEMNLGCQRIEIRHHAIAHIEKVLDDLVCRM